MARPSTCSSERGVSASPGGLRLLGLGRVALNPLVDLIVVVGVVIERSGNEMRAEPEVGGSCLWIPSFVPDGLDDLPDVETVAGQTGTAAGRPSAEDDARMLRHPHSLLQVSLRQAGFCLSGVLCLTDESPKGVGVEAQREVLFSCHCVAQHNTLIARSFRANCMPWSQRGRHEGGGQRQ